MKIQPIIEQEMFCLVRKDGFLIVSTLSRSIEACEPKAVNHFFGLRSMENLIESGYTIQKVKLTITGI